MPRQQAGYPERIDGPRKKFLFFFIVYNEAAIAAAEELHGGALYSMQTLFSPRRAVIHHLAGAAELSAASGRAAASRQPLRYSA